jgi:hypothetical protein
MPKADISEENHPPAAPRAAVELAARVEQQLSAYKSGNYNEAQLRQEFLNPLFKTLGWPRWPGPARIEHETPLVPRAVAAAVWEEVGAWLGEELPRAWLVRLTERAEAAYASNARMRRRLRSPGSAGRDWLWAFTRHWLAALIWKHRRPLSTRLPASYSVGHPLPQDPTTVISA